MDAFVHCSESQQLERKKKLFLFLFPSLFILNIVWMLSSSTSFSFLNAQARPQLYMRSNLGTTFFIVSQWSYVKCTLKCILKRTTAVNIGHNLGGHSWEHVEIMDLWQHCLFLEQRELLLSRSCFRYFTRFFPHLLSRHDDIIAVWRSEEWAKRGYLVHRPWLDELQLCN